jgi:hypothetical protein
MGFKRRSSARCLSAWLKLLIFGHRNGITGSLDAVGFDVGIGRRS